MKYSEGFSKLVPSILTVVLVAMLGILLFGEPAGMARLCCMGLMVAGIAG